MSQSLLLTHHQEDSEDQLNLANFEKLLRQLMLEQ